ncbi:MAG: hypothetical protein ACK2UW_17755 [Anaerolineales bacterium]|jgi:hypothetical protein
MTTAVSTQSTYEDVWALEEGEVRKPGIAQIVALALFTGIGIVVGTFGSLAIPIGFVSAFWPGQAIQAVGSIWYGMWGGIAAFLFPLISNAMSGSAPLPVSMAYIPANFVQGMAAGWIFRQLRLHPALKYGRDWLWFTLVGILAANAFGAFWGTWVLRLFGLITPDAHLIAWAGWFIGNSVASWVLGVLMLKFISPLVIKTKAFCKGYWA